LGSWTPLWRCTIPEGPRAGQPGSHTLSTQREPRQPGRETPRFSCTQCRKHRHRVETQRGEEQVTASRLEIGQRPGAGVQEMRRTPDRAVRARARRDLPLGLLQVPRELAAGSRRLSLLLLTALQDCGQIVASKFFPADDENGGGQYPLCETDYFRRLGLLCHQCGGALRGSYITALERKYHVDHFTCSLCPTVFGAQDSYYEHDGHVYCHYHYSTQFAQRCSGCHAAILKQFVEIFRNGQNQHWHPECYMIHKFWNVRLNAPQEAAAPVQDDPAGRELVRGDEERMEEKVYRIWSVLSTFEESSAACISDMLLHVSNGAYIDGVMVAKRFIFHVDILFRSADRLDASMAELEMNGRGSPMSMSLRTVQLTSVLQLSPMEGKPSSFARRS